MVADGFFESFLGRAELLLALRADRVALREELSLRERGRCGALSSATAATAATRSNETDGQCRCDPHDSGQPARQGKVHARGSVLEAKAVQHLAPPMFWRDA